MPTASVVVVNKLALTVGEQRWVDLVTAKGHTPRVHQASDGGAAIAATTDLIIITGSATEGGTEVINFAGPIILCNLNRIAAMLVGASPATPPTNDDWTPSSGSTGSPFLAGFTASTVLWSGNTDHRITNAPASGAQRIWDLAGNTARCVAFYIPSGGTRTDTTASPGERYVMSLTETAMTSFYTPTAGTIMSAAYDALIGSGGTPPLVVTVNDAAVSGGDSYTLTASVTGGIAPYTYAWTAPGAALDPTGLTSATAKAVMPATGGSHAWSVSVTDNVDTIDTDTATVTGTPRQVYALEASGLPVGASTSTGSTNPTTVLDDLVDGPGLTPADFMTVPSGTTVYDVGFAFPAAGPTSGADVYISFRLPATTTSAGLTVELMDGATVRGTETPTVDHTTTALQRFKVSFTPAELAAVTNPANAALRLTFTLPA